MDYDWTASILLGLLSRDWSVKVTKILLALLLQVERNGAILVFYLSRFLCPAHSSNFGNFVWFFGTEFGLYLIPVGLSINKECVHRLFRFLVFYLRIQHGSRSVVQILASIYIRNTLPRTISRSLNSFECFAFCSLFGTESKNFARDSVQKIIGCLVK